MSEAQTQAQYPFWKKRMFLFTFTGYFLSIFGSTFSQIALTVWVLQETGSAKLMSTLLISSMIISVVFGSFGGTFADRFDRRKIMYVADFLQFAIFSSIAFSIWTDAPILFVIVLNSLSSFVGVFQGPAFNAAYSDIIGKENVQKGSGMITIADNIARISGLALGGVIVQAWGGSIAITMDGLTYLICGILIFFAGKFPIPEGKKTEPSSFKQDYVDGVKRIWKDSFTRAILFVFPLLFMVFTTSFMLIQVLLIKTWKVSTVQYGLIETCVPLGYIIGASMIMWLDKRMKGRGRYMVGSMIVTAPIYISLALNKVEWMIYPHILLIGFFFAFSTQFLFVLIRMKVESAFQGRLFGILFSIGGIAPPAGIAISSAFADVYGASVVLIANAIFLLLVGLMGIFVFKSLWNVE